MTVLQNNFFRKSIAFLCACIVNGYIAILKRGNVSIISVILISNKGNLKKYFTLR